MNDTEILHTITKLVQDEHDLEHAGQHGGLSDDDRERLHQLQVNLDQCWDLLRQRRARRSAGENPDDAQVRPPSVVENYKG